MVTVDAQGFVTSYFITTVNTHVSIFRCLLVLSQVSGVRDMLTLHLTLAGGELLVLRLGFPQLIEHLRQDPQAFTLWVHSCHPRGPPSGLGCVRSTLHGEAGFPRTLGSGEGHSYFPIMLSL